MKKHKVKIPEGYGPGTLEYDTYLDNCGNKHYTAARLTLIPIKKELPKTWEEYTLKERKAIMKIAMKKIVIFKNFIISIIRNSFFYYKIVLKGFVPGLRL